MKIVNISFKNIFAYGEGKQTIEYTDNGELILLKGKSGTGKTAILSLPCLLLYGKIEKTPKTAIANRINKNGWIAGNIQANGNNYYIERTFTPNTLKVYKNGLDIENIGVKDAQEYIDNEIIEIPQITFNNMISISMKKFKSFLTMSPADRKQIIDRIFDLELVNRMYELIKKDCRDTGSLINNDNTALFQVTQSLNNAQMEMKRLQEKMKSSHDSAKIEENKKSIEKFNEALSTLQTNYMEASTQFQTHNNELQALYAERVSIQNNLKITEGKLAFFANDKCPTCGTSFDSENFITIKTQLNEYYIEQEKNQNTLIEKEQIANQSKLVVQQKLQKINEAVSLIKGKQNELWQENCRIDASLKSNNEYIGIQNIINKTQEQITLITESIKEKTNKLELLNKLLSVYSIEGVKQQVINNYLPILNREVDENLQLLDFPYQLEFDSKFDSQLKEMGIKVPVETLSDGEMTRVDLVVLCSLFKLLKCKYPSINILSIDELVSFLDVENSQVLLEFLKRFAIEMKLNIFVVSHVNIDTAYFDRCIEVYRETNGFSQIREENLSL